MANKYTNQAGETKGELAVIAAYFRKPEESLADFKKQVDALTPDDRTELATLVAKELGWTVIPS